MATAPILSILAAVLFARLALAVDLTEPQGIAHAYPALLDPNGKKLADGEFRQWIEDDRLPSDPLIRVDLVSGAKSGPAQTAQTSSGQ